MTRNTYFISDCHFGHRNIIKYCNRPWNSGVDENGDMVVTRDDVDRMTHALIENWNSVVGKDDIVWNLGDFALGSKTYIKDIFSQLNGQINLVMGNHDNESVKFYYDIGFKRVYDHPVILDDFLILSHRPIEWVKKDGVYVNLYGHVHDNSIYKTWDANGACMCVERHGYKPVNWMTIKNTIDELRMDDPPRTGV